MKYIVTITARLPITAEDRASAENQIKAMLPVWFMAKLAEIISIEELKE